MRTNSLSQPLYQKLHGCSVVLSSIVHDFMHKISVIFGVSVSKDETCFEQINVYYLFFHIPIRFCNLKKKKKIACFELIYLRIVCVNVVLIEIVMLSHIWCAIERSKRPSYLVVKAWKDIFYNCLFWKKTILTMLASQIETKRVFSIARIFTCLRWCWLGVMNLDILILLIKNWLNKTPFYWC
jgi:hypothetical protein